MFLSANNSLLFFYVQTPMHAGAGSATGAIDLPIQRERHTGRPIVQSSGVKGALRDVFEQKVALHLRETKELEDWEEAMEEARKFEFTKAVFGKEGSNNAQAGAISVTDAKILLFPVRSSHAPFFYVTCPSILEQFNRDRKALGKKLLNGISDLEDKLESGKALLLTDKLNREIEETRGVILEDIRVQISGISKETNDFLSPFTKDFGNNIPDRTLVVYDEDFKFLVESTCPVQTRIKLGENGTTSNGGNLWYQELMPNDTLLYSVVFISNERGGNKLQAQDLQEKLKVFIPEHIQMGGDATLGRGICEIKWINE